MTSFPSEAVLIDLYQLVVDLFEEGVVMTPTYRYSRALVTQSSELDLMAQEWADDYR